MGTILPLCQCRWKSEPTFYIQNSPDRISELLTENERLRQICRDAYEVWAGSEGIPEPETAAEAYLLQLLIQMRDEITKGL
jgi:hypothetical protein